jgi:hypothetical protein
MCKQCEDQDKKIQWAFDNLVQQFKETYQDEFSPDFPISTFEQFAASRFADNIASMPVKLTIDGVETEHLAIVLYVEDRVWPLFISVKGTLEERLILPKRFELHSGSLN